MTDAGQPVGGVKVRLEGAKSTSTTTDGSGHYAFSDLRAGGNYIITPVRTRMNFTPANHSFTNLMQDGLADFNGIGERDPKPVSDSKSVSESRPVSECTEADESRERRNIVAMYGAGWLKNIEGERSRIIAENVRDSEAKATLGRLEPQIIFEGCKVAYVTIRYVWQIITFDHDKPARVLNVPKQRRFFCGRMGGWFCKSM